MSREVFFGAGIGLVALMMTLGSDPGRILAQAADKQVQRPDSPKYPDRTTPIQRVMTPDQRKHAKMHGQHACGVRLLDEQVSHAIFPEPFFDDKPHPPAVDKMAESACGSAAVFLGRAIRSTSFPTDDGCSLFTDSEVEVERSFRVPAKGDIAGGVLVVVSLAGGAMMVEGARVDVNIAYAPRLMEGRRYLFATTYDAESKAFHLDTKYDIILEERGERFHSFWPIQTKEGTLSGQGIATKTLIQMLDSVRCR